MDERAWGTTEYNPEPTERKGAYQIEGQLQEALSAIDDELVRLNSSLATVWEARRLLEGKNDPDASLYDDPMYNDGPIEQVIATRGRQTEYHAITADYTGDEAKDYRHAILTVAQEHGFVAGRAGQSPNAFERFYGIAPVDEHEPAIGRVSAVIVPGAAGDSNVIRIAGALRDITSGRTMTHEIILAGCDRATREIENTNVLPYHTRAGGTEIESLMINLQDIVTEYPGVTLVEPFDYDASKEQKVSYGSHLTATTWSAKIIVNGKGVNVTAVSAPYDPARVEHDGALPRANTDETFLASLVALPHIEGGRVAIYSHDTWAKNQSVIARRTLGMRGAVETEMVAVFYDDRVLEGGDIRAPEQVVDEFHKYFTSLVKLRLEIAAKLEKVEQ